MWIFLSKKLIIFLTELAFCYEILPYCEKNINYSMFILEIISIFEIFTIQKYILSKDCVIECKLWWR
jgi:hypothetical protein